jgi:DNA-binding GntR family transcriptional regulator
MSKTVDTLPPVIRINLSGQVYTALRSALLEGRLWPGQRLKIRDLASAMQVSETPVREAVMQLVRERGLILQSNRSFTVPRLSLGQYLELRRIRLELEGLAAAVAAEHVATADLARLEDIHAEMVAAQANNIWSEAVRLNWHFHALIYRRAEMPELLNIIEGLWLRTGPLLNYQYPHAVPSYPGRHRHLDAIDRLRARDASGTRHAVQADTFEGGASLLDLLVRMDRGELDEAAFRASIPAPDLAATPALPPIQP